MKTFVQAVREILGQSQDIEEILAPNIYQFMKEKQKLELIREGVIFRQKIGKRFGSATISKLFTPDFNVAVFLTQVLDELDFKAIVSIDCDYVLETKDPESPLKFQYASRATCINRTRKLILPSDVQTLLNEFEGKTRADILNACFNKHAEILHFQESGFNPYYLISLKVFLTSLS